MIVTGSSKGIGRAIAIAFGKMGYSVVTNGRNIKRTKRTREIIENNGGEAQAIIADISKPAEVNKLIDKTKEKFGSVDVMVANAGMQTEESSVDMSYETWQDLIDINLTGTFLCDQRAARVMKKQEDGGVIINISSVHELIPWPYHVHYASAKGGMRMLTRSLALEFADKGIRVNAIAPGAIKTPMNQDILEDEEKMNELEEKIPLGRLGEPEEVAEIAIFLASDRARYVTGSTYFVDGGLSLYPSFVNG